MINSIKNRPSLFTLFLLFFIIGASRVLFPCFHTVDVKPVLSGDVFGYYLYLPAYFLHHDTGLHDFSWVRNAFLIYHLTPDFTQWSVSMTGDYILKFPVGMAVLYAPFFFMGWLFATIAGYAVDGFSYPFQVSMIIGNLVYTFTGLWFLRKVLLNFFNEWITALTVILVVMGTNYFQLAAFDGAMPHNALFMLFALVIWLTIRWHKKPEWKYAIAAGIHTGLSVLVKPSSAAIILIPVFWGIFDKASSEKKWDLIKRNRLQVILFFSYIIMVCFFQVIYLKLHSGLFFYDTYPATEKFQPVAPFLAQVLISFKKGWLIYTPVMILPLIGFYFLAEKRKEIFYATFLFFIINLMVLASWTIWWYDAGFGQRAMIESYVILSLPTGFFLSALAQKKLWLKISLSAVIVFFLLLNLFQSWQYMNHIIDPSRMTREYYLAVFGKTRVDPDVNFLLEPLKNQEKEMMDPRGESIKKRLAFYDFDEKYPAWSGSRTSRIARSGKFSFMLTPDCRFSPGLEIKYQDLTNSLSSWIRATGYVYFDYPAKDLKTDLVITCINKGKPYKYKSLRLSNEHLLPYRWNKVTMDYRIPFIPDNNDLVKVYFWDNGSNNIFIDDFDIELDEPVIRN